MKTILITNNVSVHLSFDKKLIEVKWKGDVPLKDCQLAFESVGKYAAKNHTLILNASSLLSFDSQARAWLKGPFVREKMRDVSYLLAAVANIEAKSRANPFLTALNQLASILHPHLVIKSFNSVDEVESWANQQYLKQLLQSKQAFDDYEDENMDLLKPKPFLRRFVSTFSR